MFKKWSEADDDDFSLEEFGYNDNNPSNPKPISGDEGILQIKDVTNNLKRPSEYTADDAPPFVNYDKLYTELQKYNFQIDTEANLHEIKEYLEVLQQNRSRVMQMEADADRNYMSINLTYDILFAHEFLERTEKTAKEKESGTLKKLSKWAEAMTDAKIYSNTCSKYLKQLDSTHHLLSKILSSVDLEVRLRAYKDPESFKDLKNKSNGPYTKPQSW